MSYTQKCDSRGEAMNIPYYNVQNCRNCYIAVRSR
jgi:hypothetical protein